MALGKPLYGVSFGQRRVLGKRYSTWNDPAIMLAYERLNREYELAPGRESRAEAQRQFNQQMRMREQERQDQLELAEEQAKGAMVGTGVNTAMTGAMLYGIGKGEGWWGASKAAATGAAAKTGGAGVATVTPATTDIAATGISTAPAVEAGTGMTAAAPSAEGGLSTYGPIAGAAAIEVANQMGGREWVDKQLGTTAGHVHGIASRAGQGALIGSVVPGVGTVAGAVIGGIVGAAEEATVICTELYRQGLLPEEIYKADSAYGRKLDLFTLYGYHRWAIPLANAMSRSRVLTAAVRPIATAWAYHMAYLEGVVDKPNRLGAVLLKIGVPICRFIGKSSYKLGVRHA